MRVTLHNGGGLNAYRPDKYGDAIIIERRLARQSSVRAYAALSASGRVVSERREEIAQICDHFSIQVDNPLAVLTQETAKRFLASARPRELYDFFMKATQLEQLAYDYMYSRDRIRTATGRIAAIKETWADKEAQVRQKEALLREVARQREIRQAIREKKSQIAWSVVGAREADLAGLQKELARHQHKGAQAKAERGRVAARAATIADEIAGLQREAHGFNAQLEPYQAAYTAQQGQVARLRAKGTQLAGDIRGLNQSFKEEARSIERLQAAHAAAQARTEDAAQQQLGEQLRGVQDELVAVAAGGAEARQHDAGLKAQRQAAAERLARATDLLEEAGARYDAKRRELDQARRAKGNRLAAFHERMGLLLGDVEREARAFHRAPVGPVGLYVELADPRWGVPVEALIGKELEAFIVQDQHDHDRLRALMRRHGIHSPVSIVASEEPLDIAGGEPDGRFTTALRVLRISHPLVLKTLIIQTGIERAAFLPDRVAAKDVLRRKERNVDAAFTPGDRVFVKGSSHSNVSLWSTGKLKLILDDPARLAGLEEQARQLLAEREAAARDAAQHAAEAAELAADAARAEQRTCALAEREGALKREQARLETERSASTSSLAVQEAERELGEARQTHAMLQAQFVALGTQARETAEQVAALEAEMGANMRAQDGLKQQAEATLERLHQASQFRRDADKQLGLLAQAVEAAEGEAGLLSHRIAAAEAELALIVQDVARLGERPAQAAPRAELERELARLSTVLDELARTQPDPERLLADITGLKDGLARSKRLVSAEDALMLRLGTSIQRRERIWAEWRREIAKISNMEFILMLAARGFEGKLDYDTDRQLLSIRVKPQAQAASDAIRAAERAAPDAPDGDTAAERDIRQLSGGEKSYSTACFLFSLWTAMASPLRCLDEFDVFMDQVNRDFVINEMVKNARSSRVQFVLITPNAIWNSVKLTSDIKIIRLADPVRNQTTLA